MGKARKPVSLLKRPHAKQLPKNETKAAPKKRQSDTPQPKQQPQKRHKYEQSSARPAKEQGVQPVNPIHKHSAHAVSRLLHADATGRHGATLKSLTLAPHIEAKKAVYAITVETLKHVPILRHLIDAVPTLTDPAGDNLSTGVAYVLVRDVLWGQGIKPAGPAERAVLAQAPALKSALKQLMENHSVGTAKELLATLSHAAGNDNGGSSEQNAHPRWARVNTLKMSVDQVLAWLESPPPPHTLLNVPVSVDEVLPELLHFPPGTDLHDHPLVVEGSLVLQSKASCMPARALDPRHIIQELLGNKITSKKNIDSKTSGGGHGSGKRLKAWRFIDACAAPGNKTTHLAALVHEVVKGDSVLSSNRVLAFDKDPTRLKRLETNILKAGASSIVQAQCADFLATDPESEEYSDVVAVLLDPSCSGSGTGYSRMDHLLPSAANKPEGEAALNYTDDRVEALATFQESALRHALHFPSVRRIAYSTCSVHIRENEGVVAAVLEEAQELGFEVVRVLPTWHRRGIAGAAGLGEKVTAVLVRTDAEEDGTDGFFVAVFERKKISHRSDSGGGGSGRKKID